MKPSVKPAAHLRVEWVPTITWNGYPSSAECARFVNDLPKLHDDHLPERPALATDAYITGPAKLWRTVRIRPEIMFIVEGLQARGVRSGGVELSISEVLSALLIAGLPVVAGVVHGPFRR